jgi:hypothetical protein
LYGLAENKKFKDFKSDREERKIFQVRVLKCLQPSDVAVNYKMLLLTEKVEQGRRDMFGDDCQVLDNTILLRRALNFKRKLLGLASHVQ